MEFREIKSLSWDWSVISFGGAAISGEGAGYGFGKITEEDSIKLIDEAIEVGINVFDTAPIYGFGMSEKRLGKALKSKRDLVYLISKSGVSWHKDSKRVNMTNDPKVAESMLHKSLKDLQSEYIDLYMLHWPDAKVDIRKVMEVYARAMEAGKIRAVGLCNTNYEDLQKAKEIVEPKVIQSEFNAFQNENFHFIEHARKNDMGFMSWGSLDKGILTGRVNADRTFDKEDARSWAPWWKKENKNWKYDVLKVVSQKLREFDFTTLDFALQYNLHQNGLSTAICGFRNSQQLHSILDASQKKIPKKLMLELVEIISQAKMKQLGNL